MKRSLNVSIANITGTITLTDETLYQKLKIFFNTYETKSKPQFKIILNVANNDLKYYPKIFYPILIEPENNRLNIIEKSKKGCEPILAYLDPTVNICHLSTSAKFNYSKLIAVIRTCFHHYLEKNNGFFLHASSGVVNNNAYLFTGKPDSGKSTALNNLDPDYIVGEDAIAVKNLADNRSIVFSTPFRNERNNKGEIKAIYFPVKSKNKPKIEKEYPTQYISKIISNAMFSCYNSDHTDSVMNSIIEFCTNVPSFNLYCGKKTKLQEVIL